ncbi:MAG: MBL fold metallo-hydrolase [Nitratireductor sp.]|nr:MBL fold metallo-hydrolase [Nitratireductor sp.]
MTKTHVETVQMLPFGMLNAFLLINSGKAILVDTGLPNSEDRVARALKRNGLSWPEIKLIVLTHAHIDHAGSALRLRELTSAPVLAHESDIPYLQGEPPVLRPTGTFGRLFKKTGAIEQPFDYLMPDLVASADTIDLDEFGICGQVRHTPGHTPGSVSVLLEDGNVIAGDLAASGILLGGIALKSRPTAPPFEEDAQEVANSLQGLLDLGFTRFHLGHGGPLEARQIAAHVEAIKRGQVRRY